MMFFIKKKMKFSIQIFLTTLFLLAFNTQAAMLSSKSADNTKIEILVTTFPDFYPFGYNRLGARNMMESHSVFENVLEKMLVGDTYLMRYKPYDDTKKALSDVRLGKADMFLGMYYSTKAFEGIDFVFPAALNNPVHLMMMPDKISLIKNTQDLEKLKGIYSNEEYFSDFMIQNLKNLNVEAVETTDKAYEMLMTGQADFIVGSYYYNYAKILEKGLKGYISFSSKPLWSMPLFIGLSKTYKNRKAVKAHLERILNKPEFKQTVLSDLKENMRLLEETTQGIVAPLYVRKSLENELTPADEMQDGGNK